MEPLTQTALLDSCLNNMESGQLDSVSGTGLREWWKLERERVDSFVEALMLRPAAEWTEAILEHRAHRHPWYDALATEVTLGEFATFMLENRRFPAFLPLAQRALKAQICDEARAALQRNIDDEQVPVPHAELMGRLMGALKTRTGEGLQLDVYRSLIDRTLVFYYGYYFDVWSLIGSLYVTEAVAFHRLQHMNVGLQRLGLSAEELEFIHVHMTCDEDHARDWSDGVVGPTLSLDPTVRRSIVEGIAVCLETSARYLDRQVQRLKEQRVAHAS
jgi:Iron-containing redox enzyme